MSYVLAVAQPPTSMTMPAVGQTIFMIFVHIPWVVLFGYALHALIRHHSPVPLLFLAGGVFATFFEPIVDVLGMCFFPRDGQWIGLTSFDRPVPIFMWAVYSWFVGGQAFLWWRSMRRGTLTRGMVWRMWLLTWVVNAVLETPGLLMKVYTYYGKQPFDFWGFPLWWPAVNATMPLVAAYAAYRLWPHLTGWRVLAIIPIVPMADGLANGAIAWPIWTALNTGAGYVVTYLAGAVTIGLGCLVVWVIGVGFPSRHDASASGHRATAVPASPAGSPA